jgi:protein-S-isoprenylcysteine O-methyltransferase Ste14
VRHPIYTAMLGKLLASNFAFGAWVGLPVALVVFVAALSSASAPRRS